MPEQVKETKILYPPGEEKVRYPKNEECAPYLVPDSSNCEPPKKEVSPQR